jgi:DNA-binding CsgD family transcriptional regulator/Tfp pilus assembly protein PilF
MFSSRRARPDRGDPSTTGGPGVGRHRYHLVMAHSFGPADLLVGRGPERDTLTAAIDAGVSGRPAVAWVEGEAGMGKTTLVRHVVAQLPAGVQVLQVTAEELASHVPFDLAHRLGARTTETFAAGMEILEGWSDTQDRGPLVVVVEDLHWADAASAGALLTAVQRLDEDRVSIIVTTRPGAQDGWGRFCRDSERCRSIEVRAFNEEEVAAVASSAGVELTPYQAERLRAHTGGHPLYVRTLLTELGVDELRAPDGDLPAPRSLTSSVTARLSEVPEAARSLAAALAVLNHRAALPLVGRVAGVDAPIEPFEQLLATGFVSWDPQEPGPPIEFTHPLFRRGIYQDLSPSVRRDLHRAAARESSATAGLVHRVAAADGADEELARELEAQARRALRQRDKVQAARAFEWASSLSTQQPDAERRLVDAVRTYIDAGQVARADALGHQLDLMEDGPARNLVLGMLEWNKGHTESGRRWLERVVESGNPEGSDARETVARAWAELAEISNSFGQAPDADHAARQALALASPNTTSERLAQLHGSLAEGYLHGAASGLARLRLRLPEPAEQVPGDEVDLLVVRATLAMFAGFTTAAVADLRGALALVRAGHVPVELARCHRELATLLVIRGEFDEALVQAHTGLTIAVDDRRGIEDAACHAVLGTILAYRGDPQAAATHAAAAAAAADRLGAIEAMALVRITDSALAVANGVPERVIESLDPLADGAPMLAALTFWPSLVVALLDTGQIDRAEDRIDGLVEAAKARGLDMDARILGLRARVAAAGGQLDEADELFRQALGDFGPDDPFLERILLVRAHGQVQLRQGARHGGLNSLREAREALVSIGADPFVRLVESDLKDAGIRSGRRSDRTSLELTDRERDVAVLVGKGFSNPEVAAELYVSRKAIEYHLRNIYDKLGISSRRGLRGLEI